MSFLYPIWSRKGRKINHKVLFLTIFSYLSIPVFSMAGSFQVSPVIINLDARFKKTVIKTYNSGDEKVTVQLAVKEWSKDETGSDIYKSTNDIVFFPKIVTMEKNEERIIRIGYQGKENASTERTYRLFIQELPIIKPGETALKFALNMVVPIYVSPLKEIKNLFIEKVGFSDGKLKLIVKNNGNKHVVIGNITATGLDSLDNEFFKKERKGGNVLAGLARTFDFELAEKDCIKTDKARITVKVEDTTMSKDFVLDKAQCVSRREDEKSPGGQSGK